MTWSAGERCHLSQCASTSSQESGRADQIMGLGNPGPATLFSRCGSCGLRSFSRGRKACVVDASIPRSKSKDRVVELTSSKPLQLPIAGNATKSCWITKRNALTIFILVVIVTVIFASHKMPNRSRILMPTHLNKVRLGNNASQDAIPETMPSGSAASTGPAKSESTSTASTGTSVSVPIKSAFKSVPRIFHQTYGSEMIRNEYKQFVQGCLILNSNWQYYLWRDADIEAFVQDHFPWLMNRYKGLSLKIERGDIIRYMALHYYGGVYLDMDIQCVKPLFPSLESVGPLFFDQERKEQAHMIYGHKATVMNSAIGSVPGHPFFLKLLSAINATPSSAQTPLWTTGPIILTAVFNSWIRGPEQAKNPVLLLEPEVFSPIMDGGPDYYLPRFCQGVDSKPAAQLTEREKWVKKGCDMTRSKSWKQDVTNTNVTVCRHMFRHIGWFPEQGNMERFDIRKLHPAVKMYKIHRMLP